MDQRVGPGFLVGGGEMAELIRAKDWSKTPLGPVEHWPQSLRTTVSLCLASNFPINIIWGPEHTQIYNDGYRVVCGDAHPTALGQDYSVTWASAWPAVGEPFSRALAGETTFIENQRMFLTRNGYLEETFFTFSTSPIRDESGGIGGLFHPVTETTATMLAERRTRALRDLTAGLGGAADLRSSLVSVDTPRHDFSWRCLMDEQATRPKPRSYTEDYKRQVVDLVTSSGRTPTAVAGEVGLHPTLLCRWVRQYGAGAVKAEAPRPAAAPSLKPLPVPTADQAAEIARLKRECDRLRMERDILKNELGPGARLWR